MEDTWRIPDHGTRSSKPLMDRVMAGIGMLRIEARRSIALLSVPLLVLATWWLTINDMMYSGVRLWSETSQITIVMAFLLAPASGGLSAWAATRNRRRGIEEMISVTARPPFVRELAIWAGTMLWPLLTCGAISGFYVVLTIRDATWGRPLPMPLLLGLLYIVVYSAIGYAAGRWVPSRFTAPLVAIGLFYGSWGLLLPFSYFPSLLGPDPNAISYVNVFTEPVGLWGWRMLWILGIGGAALSSVALKIRRSPLSWASLVACILAALVSAGTLVSIAASDKLARANGLFEGKSIPFEPVCEEGRITVCVHPAYQQYLPEIAKDVNEVAEPLKGLPGVPTRMVQARDTNEPEESSTNRSTNKTASFDVDSWTWGRDSEGFGSAAYALVTDEETMMYEGPEPDSHQNKEDLERCGEIRDGGYLDPAMEAQAVVANWLIKEAGGPPQKFPYYQCSNTKKLIKDFADLDPTKRHAWLEKNFADLRIGEVTLKDLP